ncbi:hypothetical protein ACLOJK_001683 [Asimina triloba]
MPSSSMTPVTPGPSPLPPVPIPAYTWNPIVISLVGSICVFFLFLSCCNILKQNLSLPRRRRPFSSTTPLGPSHAMSSEFQSRGLDSAVLRALPTVQFNKAKAGGPTDADCAVCLCEYKEGEWLKSLPNCTHVFHIACIDAWFRSHTTCPLCRSNLGNESDGCYSLSMLPLLEALHREDAYSRGERWHRYAVLAPELVENSMSLLYLEAGSLPFLNRSPSLPPSLPPLTFIHSFSHVLFCSEVPKDYKAFVDRLDGYTYYYPADWRDFDFLGHDSAFKDRILSLQNVRVSFKPTAKTDIRDLGPMNEVIFDLVRNIYAAPNQTPTIFDIKERTTDGKHYWTFEYDLASPTFARSSFSTIAIGNGRFYTLIVGANERRWSRMRNKLKVVADSFKMLDI